jgi:hypothetical protein
VALDSVLGQMDARAALLKIAVAELLTEAI